MSLKERIDTDIKTAMRAQDKVQLTTLRSIKAAIIVSETAEGRVLGTPLTEEEELKLVQRIAKQRRDSLKQFTDAGRTDLAENEAAELAVIALYLPKQLSEEELTVAIKAIIAEVGATSMKEMGKVMGIASKRLANDADGESISKLVKQLLQ